MTEEWRALTWLDSDYEVSSLGRVRSWKARYQKRAAQPRLLVQRPFSYKGRYCGVSIYPNGRRRFVAVHRLVARAFFGECPEDMEVRHLDGVATNNVVTNLAYGTKSENAADTIAHGVHNQVNKTHCPAGHPYDAANTYVRRGKARVCRTCSNEHSRRYKARKRAERARVRTEAAA